MRKTIVLCAAVLLLFFGMAAAENDSADTAMEIETDTVITDALPSSGNRYYQFTLPSDGAVKVTFSCEEAESGGWRFILAPLSGIRGKESRTLGTTFDSSLYYHYFAAQDGGGESPHLGISAGTWYIRIMKGNNYSSADYHFSLQFTPSDEWETERNNSWSDSDPVELDRTYRGALAQETNGLYASPTDEYRFEVPEDGFLTILFRHEAVASESIYWRMQLYHESAKNQSVWWTPVTDSINEVFAVDMVPVSAGENVLAIEAYTAGNGAIQFLESDYAFLVHFEDMSAFCTVSFSGNGGSGEMKEAYVRKGETYTLPECAFTPPEGKVFSRWNAGPAGISVTLTEDIDLEPVWRQADILPVPDFGEAELLLPAGTAEIRESAFENTDARVVWIPDGCLTIGDRAFADCTELMRIRIPESVTEIAGTAFDGCDGFIIYCTAGSEAQQYATVWGYQFAEE